jgi:hypothetical protein
VVEMDGYKRPFDGYRRRTTHNEGVRSVINEHFISSAKLLRYLIGTDDELETFIICNPNKYRFVTTDQEIYHALGSVKDYDNFKLNKLAKFFEAVSIKTVARKQLLTEEIVETLRMNALKEKVA